MKSVRRFLFVCFALLIVSSCSYKPTWDIIGTWENVEANETLQFLRDGVVTLEVENTSLTAPYKFSDPKHVKIYLGSLGTLDMEVSIAKDELTLTGGTGEVSRYKKVK